jgi:hypothetical protein
MAPLAKERIERAYRETLRHPSILEPEMVPLIDIMLEHTMFRTEITIIKNELEYKEIPIDFHQLSIRRRAYDQHRQNELPVYVVAPFSLKTELTPGNSKDWFSGRVSYPVQNGDAIILWKTGKHRFDTVKISYSLFNERVPAVFTYPQTDGFVDGNGHVGYELGSWHSRFGVVFAGCTLVAERSGIKTPNQFLVFG